MDTRNAVMAFQRSKGLTIDGEVGPDTAAALKISL
jgi:peptidoglycan hydrolase-like protein with peptidoglycan-binding domain